MCRWLAYSGGPIYIEELVLQPENSLIDQSLHAQRSESTTNGDGFGLGWYGPRSTPALYRSIQPAWNDANLRDLAAQITSSLFLAHVRAATGTAVNQSNCHPFRYGKWLFVHNGVLDQFELLRRDLIFAVAPELFNCIRGTTDSEVMFHLALTFGLLEEPIAALERMVGFIEKVGTERGVPFPVQMSLGLSDGECLYGVRYSTEGKSRTLFHSQDMANLRQIIPAAHEWPADARAVVSEPLGHLHEWIEIPESSVVIVQGGEVERREFAPRPPDSVKWSAVAEPSGRAGGGLERAG